MSNGMYFVRECPTCGRHLYIRVEYLGKKVVCQHCLGKLEARDPSASETGSSGTGSSETGSSETGSSETGSFETAESLLRRADELLDRSTEETASSRLANPS